MRPVVLGQSLLQPTENKPKVTREERRPREHAHHRMAEAFFEGCALMYI